MGLATLNKMLIPFISTNWMCSEVVKLIFLRFDFLQSITASWPLVYYGPCESLGKRKDKVLEKGVETSFKNFNL